MSQKFFTRRFFLDTPINRFTNRGGDHYIGPFRSFWVSDTNNSSFKADLVINPREDRGRGIPLRLNQCQAIGETVDDKAEEACIEFETAQPGVWIDITFAQDDKISVGSVVVESSGATILIGGSSFTNDKFAVTDAGQVLLPASDQRAKGEIYNQTEETFFVGSQAKITAPDFAETCIKVRPGNEIPFVWDLPDALYCRKETVGTIYPVILVKNK